MMLTGSNALELFPSPSVPEGLSSGVSLYGTAIAVDGNRAVVGVEHGAAVYVFELAEDEWSLSAKLQPTRLHDEFVFGGAVAIDGDTIVVGENPQGTYYESSGAAYVFSLEGERWVQSAVLRSNEESTEDFFGLSVAIEGGTIVVGAPVDDSGNPGQGAVYIYEQMGDIWQQSGKLDSDEMMLRFGESLSINGGRIVTTGVSHEEGQSEYQVFIFEQTGSEWQRSASFLGAEGEDSHASGSAVDIDGSTLVFSSRFDGLRSANVVGVYEHQGGQWTEVQKLTSTFQADYDRYGASVAIDGESIVVGSPGKVEGGHPGAVYLFQRESGGAWIERDRFTGLGETLNFGLSVEIAGDRVLAGAPTSDPYNYPQGDVHQFQLVPNDSDVGLINFDYATPNEVFVEYALQGGLAGFELRVFRSADEQFDAGDLSNPLASQTIAVGDRIGKFVFDPGEFDVTRPYLIAIAVSPEAEYTVANNVIALEQLAPSSPIEQFPRLMGDNAALPLGGVGRSIDVDGRFAVVGLAFHDEIAVDAGAAYVYEKVGGLWQYRQALFAPEGKAGDVFGISVAIDGDMIIVGASGDDDRGTDAGAAHVFRFSGEAWVYDTKLTASHAEIAAGFGKDVAIDGATIVVAAPLLQYRGSAFVFDRRDDNWFETAELRSPEEFHVRDWAKEVAIDRGTIIISSSNDELVNAVNIVTAVHEFELRQGTWAWQGYVTDFVPGRIVPIAIDNGTVLVGNSWDVGRNSGFVQVFERMGGDWYVSQWLYPNQSQPYGRFGAAVAIQGSTIVVGAPDSHDDAEIAGMAFVFRKSGDGDWVEWDTLSVLDGEVRDNFGVALAISEDDVFIGAPQSDASLSENPGHVHAFELSGFGYDVAISSMRTIAAGIVRVAYALQGDATQFQLSIYRSADKQLDAGDLAHPVLSQEVVGSNEVSSLDLEIESFDPQRPYLIAVATTSDNESRLENNYAVLTSPLLLGDYNLDGRVDAADYSTWRDALGTTGLVPCSGADGDGDGTVDQDDYLVWKANFGRVFDAGSQVSRVLQQGAGSGELGVSSLAVSDSIQQGDGREDTAGRVGSRTSLAISGTRAVGSRRRLELLSLDENDGRPQMRPPAKPGAGGRVQVFVRERDLALLAWRSSWARWQGRGEELAVGGTAGRHSQDVSETDGVFEELGLGGVSLRTR